MLIILQLFSLWTPRSKSRAYLKIVSPHMCASCWLAYASYLRRTETTFSTLSIRAHFITNPTCLSIIIYCILQKCVESLSCLMGGSQVIVSFGDDDLWSCHDSLNRMHLIPPSYWEAASMHNTSQCMDDMRFSSSCSSMTVNVDFTHWSSRCGRLCAASELRVMVRYSCTGSFTCFRAFL